MSPLAHLSLPRPLLPPAPSRCHVTPKLSKEHTQQDHRLPEAFCSQVINKRSQKDLTMCGPTEVCQARGRAEGQALLWKGLSNPLCCPESCPGLREWEPGRWETPAPPETCSCAGLSRGPQACKRRNQLFRPPRALPMPALPSPNQRRAEPSGTAPSLHHTRSLGGWFLWPFRSL